MPEAPREVTLSVVVPFYDEEGCVGRVLCACLAAVRGMGAAAEVIAVDDGSSDGSLAEARAVAGVTVLSHGRNRGYGAALATGFEAARGEWLAFLDADGTCDPACLPGMLAKARAEGLDVVVGARLHEGACMPPVREAGNRLFRSLLRLAGVDEVSDVASGIRVLSREAYERMAPLPEGMCFTPAMSARALLDPALSIGEVPVPYAERVGASKLCPLCDGVNFLRVILETALVYRPQRVFGWASAGFLTLAALLFVFPLGGPSSPLASVLRSGPEPWMYFRFVLIAVAFALAVFLVPLGLVAQSLVGVIHRDRRGAPVGPGRLGAMTRVLPGLAAASFVVGVAANAGPLGSYLRTGHISGEYWVAPIVGAVLTALGVQLLGFWVAAKIAEIILEKERARSRRP
ncbi:MAG: glycosyltransferase family 2 protein [Elusimicrobia bacterium]|nr:glycosyltransferase family 2 protein [Elusimicrobiota bacterium]